MSRGWLLKPRHDTAASPSVDGWCGGGWRLRLLSLHSEHWKPCFLKRHHAMSGIYAHLRGSAVLQHQRKAEL